MQNILAVSKREFSSYFNSPIAYLVVSAYLILSGALFFPGLFLGGQADMRGFFELGPLLFFIITPMLTMRLLAEERAQGTLELLLKPCVGHAARHHQPRQGLEHRTRGVQQRLLLVGRVAVSCVVMVLAHPACDWNSTPAPGPATCAGCCGLLSPRTRCGSQPGGCGRPTACRAPRRGGRWPGPPRCRAATAWPRRRSR